MEGEFRFHIEMETDHLMRARGLAADEARRQALAALGGVQKHREELRDGRGLAWLGSLSLGELAGERLKLGLLLHDPEEEHDCVSDNTHNSHHSNVVGMRSVYLGEYRRTDGSVVRGTSLSDFVRAGFPALDREMRAKFDATLAAFVALKMRAETVEAYDQMLGDGNADGNAVVQNGIDKLLDQTRTIERIIASLRLNVTLERSQSLDNPGGIPRR